MLTAISVGKRAAAALAACPRGRVPSGSNAACNLLTDAGAFASLVARPVGHGPLNIVADAGALPPTLRDARFIVTDDILEIGALRLSMDRTITWDPSLDPRLIARARSHLTAEPDLLSASLAEADAILAASGCAAVLNQGADAITEAFLKGDEAMLESAARALVGLGPGLTPAGDDWLAGWLLGLRLAGAHAAERAGAITVRVAAGRTTLLSQAYLECAAAGEVDAGWLGLLNALAEEPPGAPRGGMEHESAKRTKNAKREDRESGAVPCEGDSSLDSRRYGDVGGNPLRMTSPVLSMVGVPDQSLRAVTKRLLARGATSGAAMLRGFAMGAAMSAERAPGSLVEVKA